MKVEIWSDVACPWCYVGKRRFETALEQYEHAEEVEVVWRSFELDPAPRPAGEPGADTARLAQKYGIPVAQAAAMQENLTAVAAQDGLDMRFDRVRGGSTFDAHRVIHLAAEHGVQDAAKERLLQAYFSDGEDVTDHGTLVRLAEEAGIPRAETHAVLESDRFADAVRADAATARSLGISAVPFFVVDRAYGAAGAQPPETLVELLRRARPEPAISIVADGDTCGVDGC